jgi:[protein-PII] uridylyltransferase
VRAQLTDRAEAARAQRGVKPGDVMASVEDAYWVQFDDAALARHARALAGASGPVTVAASIDVTRGATEILISAPDRPGLFADLCGAISAAGANVAAAHLYEAGGKRVLDVFDIQDSKGAALGADHAQALHRVIEDLRVAAASGEGVRRPGKQPAITRRHAAFIISPLVRIDRTASANRTVMEVSGRDRPGLLYDIARELADSGLSIRSAHVGAYGERVHDVFYVTTLSGEAPPTDLDAPLTERLVAVLRSGAPTAPRIPAHTLARAPASFDR